MALQPQIVVAACMADLEAVAAFERDRPETFPDTVARRLVADESPVKVFREHRGLSQVALAEATDLSAAYVSQIEAGVRSGSVDVLKRIAAALSVDLDLIV